MNTLLYNKCMSVLEENKKYKQNLYESFDIFDRTNFNIDFYSNLSSDRLQLLNNKTYQTPSLFMMSQATSKVGYKYGIHLYFPIQEWVFESSQKFARNEGGHNISMKGQKPKQSILQCRKNIKLFYGTLDTNKLQQIVEQAASKQSTFAQNFFSLIESRLDVVLYRSGFAKTIRAARQAIRHSKVYVNNKRCRVSSTLCKPGDIITFSKYNVLSLRNNVVNKKEVKNHEGSLSATLLLALVYLRRIRNHLDISTNFPNKIRNLENILRIINSKKRLKLSDKNFSQVCLNEIKNKIDFEYLILKFLENLKDQNKISSNLWNNGISSFGALMGYYEIIPSDFLRAGLSSSAKQQGNGFINYINKAPSHLEISKISNNIIFLYSPQKISLPFHIDVDILRKI